jgi:predicted metal-binding membrane protein
MLAAMAAPTRPLLWMVAATVLITAEKLLERPRRVLQFSAVALAGLGVLAAALRIIGSGVRTAP